MRFCRITLVLVLFALVAPAAFAQSERVKDTQEASEKYEPSSAKQKPTNPPDSDADSSEKYKDKVQSDKSGSKASGNEQQPGQTDPPYKTGGGSSTGAAPASLTTGKNKTGASAQSISVPTGPGTIEGMVESFSAQDSTGVSTFQVPFALPAPRGGVQPSLGLSYTSGGGNGIAGMGWSVGVPYIARQTDIVAFRGTMINQHGMSGVRLRN